MFNNIIKYHTNILKALFETFTMVTIASVIGIIIGFVLGTILYVTSKKGIKPNRIVNTLVSVFINIFRSIPFMLLAIIILPLTRIIVGRGFGSVAASVPLTIVAISLFARFSEQAFETVNANIIKSGKAMAASTYQIIRYFVLSEALPNLILGYTSAIISIISFSTALGIVGGGGIGDFAIFYGYTNNNYDLMFFVIIIMIIIIQIIQFIGNRLASSLNKNRR